MTTANFFVTKLPREITDADLMSIFADFDPVSAKVMLDAKTGTSKGFGFVLFKTTEAGSAATEALNRTVATVHSRNFHIVMQPSKHDGRISCIESNALYIRNIPMTVSGDEIQSFLSLYGTLVYSAMRQDHYGNRVWVVYAEYHCVDCAKQSLTKFHGSTSFFDSPLPLLAKFADTNEVKEDRRRRRGSDGIETHNAPPPSTTLIEDQPSTSRTYRHNPYQRADSPVCNQQPAMHIHERKGLPRAGPWIFFAAY